MLKLAILLLASITTGCVPSLCLFNCGDRSSTKEERAHRWDNNNRVPTKATFTQDGREWQCLVAASMVQPDGTHNAKCLEVKP